MGHPLLWLIYPPGPRPNWYAFHMKLQAISSPDNPLLRQIRLLHERSGREKAGLFLIEGRKPVQEALDRKLPVTHIVVSQSMLADVGAGEIPDCERLFVVDDRLFKRLVTTDSPCGMLAVAEIPTCRLEDVFASPPLVLVAESLQDPGNLGTIIRSCLAAGATGMICTGGSVDPFNPKVVRAAAGALFALPVIYDVSFAEAAAALKAQKVKLVACQMRSPRPYWQADFTGGVAVVLGNEGRGLSAEARAAVDDAISIPMCADLESLNVSVCAAVIMFEALRQRQKLGRDCSA
jgi:RNA methyltransferase, TrmH family